MGNVFILFKDMHYGQFTLCMDSHFEINGVKNKNDLDDCLENSIEEPKWWFDVTEKTT